MTRKEQKEEKKKRILMTALELFVKKGYYETKISDIAEAVPMSVGLLFHYFESKEVLLLELVRMGVEGTGSADSAMSGVPADIYLEKYLEQIFAYADKQPWVFNMFVLMGQARRVGMPEEARVAAASVNTIASTAKLIETGQKEGVFHEGDAGVMSKCFWASVQGIMEELAIDKDMTAPKPEWIVRMLK